MSDAAPASRTAGWLPLVGLYGLYYGTVGILLPFLPAYLKGLSLSGAQVGALLALGPLMSLVAPPLFGHWADRTGRLGGVLTFISVGAFLGLLPLLRATTFWAAAVALAAYAFFSSSITTLLDSMALHRVAVSGGSYARLRLFGSAGFVCSSALFGALVEKVDRWTVIVPLSLVACYAGWSLTLRAQQVPPAGRQRAFAAWGVVKSRDVALLLAASALHWIACAPFHGNFSIHVAALALPPSVVGASAGLGVLAEIAVMLLYPIVAERFSPRHVLAFSFAASAVRWWGMSVAHSAGAIMALSLLHGLTFGAFYIGAVGFLARRIPASQRASGQALLVAVTFGFGGLCGYLCAGAGYDWLGGHRLFAVGGALEVVAAGIVLLARPSRATAAQRAGE
jgi:PPP family 3-phenylpropionic acid transporter